MIGYWPMAESGTPTLTPASPHLGLACELSWRVINNSLLSQRIISIIQLLPYRDYIKFHVGRPFYPTPYPTCNLHRNRFLFHIKVDNKAAPPEASSFFQPQGPSSLFSLWLKFIFRASLACLACGCAHVPIPLRSFELYELCVLSSDPIRSRFPSP